MDRTVESILAEWRAAEAQRDATEALRDGDVVDPGLEERIETLKLAHAAAIEARSQEAEELARLGPAEA